MSDERLRALERRWQVSGLTQDEGALLRARLQVGALAPERLELAAWLGHAGARAALGDHAPLGGPPRDRWVAALAGDHEGRRALAGAARRELSERLPETPLDGERGAGLLRQLDAWLRAPGPDTAGVVAGWPPGPPGELLNPLLGAPAGLPAGSWARTRAVWGLIEAVSELAGPDPAPGARELLGALPREETALEPLLGWLLGASHARGLRPTGPDDEARFLAAEVAAGRLSRERLALAAWAGDPVAARALGQEPPRHPPAPRAWVEGLSAFPGQAALLGRALLAAVPWDSLRYAAQALRGGRSARQEVLRALEAAEESAREGEPASYGAPPLAERARELRALGARLGLHQELARDLGLLAAALEAASGPTPAVVAALRGLLPLRGEDVVDGARRVLREAPLA